MSDPQTAGDGRDPQDPGNEQIDDSVASEQQAAVDHSPAPADAENVEPSAPYGNGATADADYVPNTFAGESEAPVVSDEPAPPSPSSPSALSDAIGDSDDDLPPVREWDESGDSGREPVAGADDAPTTKADVPIAVAEPVDDSAALNTTPEEPDYEALAAELEEYERRTQQGSSDTTSQPASDDSAAVAAGDRWYGAGEPTAPHDDAATVVAPVAPVAAPASSLDAPVAQQPVYVQVPEPPVRKGNRAAAGGIGLVAALTFAVLFFGATLGLGLLAGTFAVDTIVTDLVTIASSVRFWTTIVVFFIAFWLLGAIVNRARWASWVVLGFFVALLTYGGYLLGGLLEAPFWMVSGAEGQAIVTDSVLAPLAIVAFIFAREITIWFGGWAAKRGAKVSLKNEEAEAEYQRTLEAGPRLPE